MARLEATGPAASADPLPRFDAWTIDRISRRLARTTDVKTPHPSAPAGRGRDDLRLIIGTVLNFPPLCAGLDVPVHEVTVTRPSLDDVFLHHTGHHIRDESRGGG